jgi:alkanesulfonate monooxygenase SsuD/methylene tetrahydromethanopterin reductase-like flavin-dependent oxidoreductase (luciferase family)
MAEPSRVVELAKSAEAAGWDGFFLWDHILAVPGRLDEEASATGPR